MRYLVVALAMFWLSGCAGAAIALAPVAGEVAGAATGQTGYTTQAWKAACDTTGGDWHGGPGAECEGNLLAAIFGEED